MNKSWKEWLLAVGLAWGMPWLMLGIMGVARQQGAEPVPQVTPTQATEVEVRETVSVLVGERLESMELDEYITGVLLGEIPAGFHTEAKKAQAVVARTYTLRTVLFKDKHPGAVCTDPACCQGYCSAEEYLKQGGSAEAVSLAREAVLATEGLVLTYKGELIDATYFSCSGGQTEDAVAVWGADVPYLQSVVSPGEENAAHYSDTVTFTAQQFQQALGRTLTGQPEGWIGAVIYTQGGGVGTMYIGGQAYSGTQLRSLLGLRSTAFSVSVSQGLLTVTTKGFGHRVGMSQYGAEAMAQEGNSYRQILQHYYTGSKLQAMDSLYTPRDP